MPRALLDIPDRNTVRPAFRQSGEVLRHRARAETVRRVGGLRVRQMDPVAREEHLHLVPFLDSRPGDEKRERCSRGFSGPVAEWTRIRAMSFVLRLVVTA